MAAWSDFGGCGGQSERDVAQAQLEQAVAAPGLAVVIALGRGPADDLDLPVVQSEAPIDGGDLRLDRPLIGQKDSRRAAFDEGRGDRAGLDIGERLRGEDDGGVLLAQRLQPFAELPRETRVVEREPAFVDDEERRPSIEPAFDAMEEIGENGRRRAPADEAFGLEHLHVGLRPTARLRRRAAGQRDRRDNRAEAPVSARWIAAGPTGR